MTQYTHGDWKIAFNESEDRWEADGPNDQRKHSKSLASLRLAIDKTEVEVKAFKRFDAYVVRSYQAGYVRVTVTSKGENGRMRCTYPDGRNRTEPLRFLFEVSPENEARLKYMQDLETELEALNDRRTNARLSLKPCTLS